MRVSLRKAVGLSLLLVALDTTMRLTPHPPNFTPLAASALFASFLFESSVLAAAIPMLALGISDYFIGAYDWHIMMVVYLSLAFPALFGRYLQKNNRLAQTRVLSAALASSVVFFLTTNFAVWYFADLYARDVKSLLQCYIVAIPFFKNTVSGDLLWSGVLFGSYAIFATFARDTRVSSRLATMESGS